MKTYSGIGKTLCPRGLLNTFHGPVYHAEAMFSSMGAKTMERSDTAQTEGKRNMAAVQIKARRNWANATYKGYAYNISLIICGSASVYFKLIIS